MAAKAQCEPLPLPAPAPADDAVPHPVPGEPPLIAANITGLPDDFLPLPPGKPKEFYTICNSGYMGEAPFGAVRDLAPAHMQSDFHGLLKDLLHRHQALKSHL